MIIDLTLEDQSYFLKINKKFFKNKSMPIALLQSNNLLIKKYSYLGLFCIDGSTFGLGGCFKKQSENDDYIIYRFSFPKKFDYVIIKRMLLTVYLSTYYVVDKMFFKKEFISEAVWDDQSLSFFISDGMYPKNGYSISGQLYPWFKKKIISLDDKNLECLNQYVSLELERMSMRYFGHKLFYSEITINRDSFFVQVSAGGRWLSCKLDHSMDKLEEFYSHNIDSLFDQELCFNALVAMNTWLRRYDNKKAK